ncbi:TerD family protein [Pseudoalteromonas sp. NEC-BIFX-2020_015]|uniref:TerD family protein n=1 Tax=Pseudoalteromonas sp. NEC-BIFX-2020_015 TaxID=2729544 RepID=UPI00146167C5|nr:TerD family protein [Pseudoalteromonas sp. NEC-BIFX-2020_015]NMR24032.1 TerD family protein [Pseudoalteromonas sp. NEC-BIFX-2020_015]
MAISLQKGANVSLEKIAPGISKCLVGLGWDSRSSDGADFDLDASAFMLNEAGKIISDQHFVFYGALTSPCLSIEHTGDNLTGEGDGDDESIKIDLSAVPSNVHKVVIGVTIHDANARFQNFGQVSNAFIRVVNEKTGEEIIRYDLSEDYSTETAIIFGELYRHNNEWKFRAVGQGYAGGLHAMAVNYGVNIA